MRLVNYYPAATILQSGVAAAIKMWSEASSRHGAESVLIHADPNNEGYIRHLGSTRATYIPVGLKRALRAGDLLILHEGWTISNLVAAWIARRNGTPYVVVPHGVYEPGVMEGLRLRKGPRTWLEAWVLRSATAVHIFHSSEAPLIEAISRSAGVVVFPTCISPTEERWRGGGDYFAWVGRLDPRHKGLDVLLEGVKRIGADQRPSVRLHGPDYKGGRRVVELLIDEKRLGATVKLAGPIESPAKEEFLRNAKGYIHLSAWECMSIALLEALAAGVPCLISDTMHISSKCAEYSSAVVVPRDPDLIASALKSFGPSEMTLSANARRMLEEVYNWDLVIPAYLEALRSLLENG